ncbi:uncharacterized protein YhfF [Motilibacter rhizosphaerae]|uniref:Uncharacterized protein YhfF n=1 Tax=Motilibacter rhizosphaerae TaxID=598652 RepID=A0A4Q7NQ39_9ACTN|nr:ASCH domain-containing protein [Motilibacter rhizosphaerae]RZS87445.1 uncharacterized protein YhfF [Motilibacter rhizosphaerae]
MEPIDDQAVARAWSAYRAASGDPEPEPTDVVQFGDSAAMADELLALVLDGTKRATAGLVRDSTPERRPRPGWPWLVCDGAGTPRAVLRTTEVRTGLLDSVDDAFAWDEGEGDRTRASWLEGHLRYFLRQGEREGVPFDPASDEVLFERFELVWTA